MSVIAIVSGSYSFGEEVAKLVSDKLEYELINNKILNEASKISGLSEDKLKFILSGWASFFNNITHEKEKALVCIKAAMVRELKQDNIVCIHPASLFIPREIKHVLKICLVADTEYRIKEASTKDGLSKAQAEKKIKKDDEGLAYLADYLFKHGPWDSTLYDLKIPMQTVKMDEAVIMICKHVASGVVNPSEESLQKTMDYILASEINIELCKNGLYFCDTSTKSGDVFVAVNKEVIRFERLENEIKKLIEKIQGVKSVVIKTGPRVNQPNIIGDFDFNNTPKILLVDDEQEYVLTLSERLKMREFNSDVVYDGEQALSYIEKEKPEVMVLDLRMPGIDGLAVLQKTKSSHPEIEIIILTGHGSEEEKNKAMELGAFAFLHKPVDIGLLSKTMKEAAEKVKSKKSGK